MMTLEKFIKTQKNKILIKYLLAFSIILLFFFTLNLDFQDYIIGFSRLKNLILSMMRLDTEDYKIVFFKLFETFIIAFSSSFLGVLIAVFFSQKIFLRINI